MRGIASAKRYVILHMGFNWMGNTSLIVSCVGVVVVCYVIWIWCKWQ